MEVRNAPGSFGPTDTQYWERSIVEAEHSHFSTQLAQVAQTDTIRNAIDLAVRLMRIPIRGKVLDVGCGTGAAFGAMAAALGDGTITGIDHGTSFLNDARTTAVEGGYADRVNLIQGDAHHLPFPEAYYDAAHTERVLMHVADPDQVMRELRRVVKPGGWIVCVEPDLAGMRIDLDEDHDGMAIIRGFCTTLRNPNMGLRLSRTMATAGLVERSVDTLTETQHELPEDVAEILADSADIAVSKGWLTTEAAAAAMDALRAASRNGTYTSYASMFVVAARVPS